MLNLTAVLGAAVDTVEDVKEVTNAAAEGAVDVLNLLLWMAIGAAIGAVIAILLMLIMVAISRSHPYVRMLNRRSAKPLIVTLAIFSSHLGLQYQAQAGAGKVAGWVDPLDHGIVIAAILSATWLLVAGVQTVEDVTRRHYARADEATSQRVKTQTQVIRRVVQAVIIVGGVVAAVLTFPSARVAVSSIFASAGLVSIIAGFAAQNTLSNMFAGVQMALTDSVRVGDIVLVGGADGANLHGTVEEVTLTYVVIRYWDDRRVIVPSQWFTQHRFENWTRRHTNLLGSVDLQLDYRASVELIRAEVSKILDATDLWDGRTASVQVTDVTDQIMTVRAIISAVDSATLWDLRCHLREKLVEFVVATQPHALPRVRWQQEEIRQVQHDIGAEKIAKLAAELAQIEASDDTVAEPIPGLEKGWAQPLPSPSEDPLQGPVAGVKSLLAADDGLDHAAHRARLKAAKQRARKAKKRTSLRGRKTPAFLPDEQGHIPAGDPFETAPHDGPHHDRTEVFRPEAVAQILAQSRANEQAKLVDTASDRLFSGSADADARAQAFSGPGEEVLAERERMVQQSREAGD